MSKKKTLVFVDEGLIKVVFGTRIKCIKPRDLSLRHNKEFLDQIFYNTSVVAIDSLSVLSREEMEEMVVLEPEPEAAPPGPRDQRGPAGSPAREPRNQAGPPPSPRPDPAPRTESFQRRQENPTYVVGVDKMTIIVDDVLTGSSSTREGVEIKDKLVLFPGKPVDTTSLDKESLSGSNILPRLLASGKARMVGFDEAMAMLEEHERMMASQSFSVHDSPSDGMIMNRSAREAASSMFSDNQSSDVETIDISGYAPREGEKSSMEQLMSGIAEAEAAGEMPPRASQQQFRGFRRAEGS